jgi:kynurenine formamidase
MTLREGIMTFPVHWHPVVEITQLGRFHVEGRETRKIALGTHTGTHVDAPRHFIRGGQTIEHTDLDLYYGPARLIDFTDLPNKTEISKDMLVERVGKDFPPRLVLRYDWDQRLDSLAYYYDHPFLSEEACEWTVTNGIRLVGFDAPMPDNPLNGRGAKKDSPNHAILLGAGVAILEYLVNLSQIPVADFILSALPLKIEEGDGAPVRAVAIVPDAKA